MREIMDCIAIGDSIAVGIGQAERCTISAKVGASSSYIAQHMRASNKEVSIISAGSNDPSSPHLKDNLTIIRSKVSSERVIWILPYNRKAASIVKSIALSNRDEYIDLAGFKSHDSVHPARYGDILM